MHCPSYIIVPANSSLLRWIAKRLKYPSALSQSPSNVASATRMLMTSSPMVHNNVFGSNKLAQHSRCLRHRRPLQYSPAIASASSHPLRSGLRSASNGPTDLFQRHLFLSRCRGTRPGLQFLLCDRQHYTGERSRCHSHGVSVGFSKAVHCANVNGYYRNQHMLLTMQSDRYRIGAVY